MLNIIDNSSSIHVPDSFPLYCEWHIRAIKTSTGELLHEERNHNLIVLSGRLLIGELITGTGGGPTLALGIGACSTNGIGVGPWPYVTDTHLYYEHILDGTRPTVKNTAGSSLTSADWKLVTYTDALGNVYYYQLVARAMFTGATDANQNQPVQEFGLFTVNACPSTPTGISGIMLNHFIAANPVPLTPDITLIVDTYLHI